MHVFENNETKKFVAAKHNVTFKTNLDKNRPKKGNFEQIKIKNKNTKLKIMEL